MDGQITACFAAIATVATVMRWFVTGVWLLLANLLLISVVGFIELSN